MGRRAHERSVGVRLLEREGEIAQLDALLGAAVGGAGRTALVEAAAGLGKSRLLDELRTRAADRGFRVLRARGSELEREFSFGIVRQLFGGELADGPAARIVAAGEEPTLAARGADETFRTLHALYWLVVEAATSHGPLLLTIDDLHWADEPSLRWLSFLGRRIDELRLLVVTAQRPSDPTAESPLVAGIASDPATFVLRLRPLSESAVAQLVRATLAPDADRAFCRSCHYATGGNPLFLGHLLDALGEEGVSPDSAGAERVAEVGPRSVLRSVRVRLSALGEEAVRYAESVAVLGDDADPGHAGLLARLEPSSVPRLVAALIEAEILRSGSRTRLSFVHPIVRAAVYEGISPIDREVAHVRAADVLRRVGAEPERVAAQLLRTEPRGDERSVTTLRQAAREARLRGAPDGAARLLERALAEPPLPAVEGEVLYELGSALRSVSAPDALAKLREAIDTLDDSALRGHAAFELGQTAFFLGDQGPVAEVLMRESDRLAETESDLSRRLEAIALGIMIEDPALYALAADRLERVRKEQPSDGLGARMVMGVLAYHDARVGRAPDQVVRWARRALEERAWEEWPLGFNSGLVLAAADELDEADALYGRILDASRERGSILSYALASCFRGEVAFDRGDLSRAGADLWQAAEAVEQSGFAGGVPTAHAILARVMVEQGDADGAAAVLERVGAGPLDTVHRTSLLLARAITRLARRDVRGGVDDLLSVGRRAESLGIRNPAMGGWRWAAAEGFLALGDQAEARRLAREDLDLARAWRAPSALGRALRIAGLAEGGRDGMDLLVEAAGVLERSSNGLEQAKALVELGAALRRANRRSDSREPLQRGLELADRAGARPVAERAHAELLATGARPRRIARSGLAALTPSERRVSELAAQGMTNKEIAHSLFVTLRTVEVHLTAAYRKLDIESRTQLAVALSSDGDA